jgi:DNA-binding transcriptional MerR regulator
MSTTKDTYTIKELAETTRLTPRAIRGWIKAGLLPPPEPRGARTVYEQVHVKRILAIKRLRSDLWMIADIRRWLSTASPEDIERIIRRADLMVPRPAAPVATVAPVVGAAPPQPAPRPPASTAAVSAPPAPASPPLAAPAAATGPAPATPPAASPTPRQPPPEPSYPAERWERVVLHPGLELHVRDEPALRRLAQEIFRYFGPAGR